MMSHFAVLISPRLNGGLIATFIFEAPFTALHLALILFIYLQSHLHMSQSEMHNFFYIFISPRRFFLRYRKCGSESR